MLFHENFIFFSSFYQYSGHTDGQTDGRKEIHPCLLQDIGPLGPLPKKGTDRPMDGRKDIAGCRVV